MSEVIEATPLAVRGTAGAISERSGSVSLLPVEVMENVLGEYALRRRAFRGWLLGQMVQGVHYGVVPGCEPKLNPDGDIIMWNGKTVGKDQWRSRPSLYKAGAQMLCDLLMLQPTFEPDLGMWQMAGSPAGTFYVKCRLIYTGGKFFTHKAVGEVMGEGVGAFKEFDKKMADNSAVKLAQKRAIVDAVINALSIADLFTQDLEDLKPPKGDAPPAAPDAPQIGTRSERAKPSPVTLLAREWATKHNGGKADAPAFFAWAKGELRTDIDMSLPPSWTVDAIDVIREALK